jgi:ABC-type uncharacterized transport system ATPase subunit
LVVAQPTWGVDVGAAADHPQALVDLAAQGAAMLVISEDLDELFETLRSAAASSMPGPAVSPPVPIGGLNGEEIGLLMGGVGGESHQAESAHA